MSKAHVEKFAELIGKDPALLAKLGLDKVNADAAAAASVAAFITNAVKEAKALGLEFTEEEAYAFLAAQTKAEASGEMSDILLEAVAGGKGEAVRNETYKQLGKLCLDEIDKKNNWGGGAKLGKLIGSSIKF